MDGWFDRPPIKEEAILYDFNNISSNTEDVIKRLNIIAKELEPEFKAKLQKDGYLMQSYVENRILERIGAYEKS